MPPGSEAWQWQAVNVIRAAALGSSGHHIDKALYTTTRTIVPTTITSTSIATSSSSSSQHAGRQQAWAQTSGSSGSSSWRGSCHTVVVNGWQLLVSTSSALDALQPVFRATRWLRGLILRAPLEGADLPALASMLQPLWALHVNPLDRGHPEFGSILPGLVNLRYLSCSGAGATTMDSLAYHVPAACSALVHLQGLTLRAVDVPMEGMEALLAATGLKELHLIECTLDALPDTLGGLHSLRTLYMRRTQIRHLPSTFTSLTSLRKLVWLGCPDDVGCNQAGQLTALDSLAIGTTRDTVALAALTGLTGLRELYFWDPSWERLEVSDCLSTLVGLEQLTLDVQFTKRLPDSITTLTKLTYIKHSRWAQLADHPPAVQAFVNARKPSM
jgi:hypothetical protein